MFGRKDKGNVVFQSKWFVLVQRASALLVVEALFLFVSEQKHFVYMLANSSKYIVSCLD